MSQRKVTIAISIPKALNDGVEAYVKAFNKRKSDEKTSKSEFFALAGIKFLSELIKDVKVPEDKEVKE